MGLAVEASRLDDHQATPPRKEHSQKLIISHINIKYARFLFPLLYGAML